MGIRAMMCVQLNCRITDTTISLEGNLSANCIILSRFFSEKDKPYTKVNSVTLCLTLEPVSDGYGENSNEV
jgi:hypothetical protein